LFANWTQFVQFAHRKSLLLFRSRLFHFYILINISVPHYHHNSWKEVNMMTESHKAFLKLSENDQFILMCEMHAECAPDEDISYCDCNRCVSIREAN
jgi:hypothetical protein